jgi:P22 coat protein - gene protein 5
MALPTNILQTVQTYQESELAYLLNLSCFVSTANTRFKDFERMEANLGDTVTFDLPPRYVTANSLVATFQASQQRVQTLTVDQAVNTSYTFTNQQFIFNVREYMDRFGKSAVTELASVVEANIALNAISGVVANDPAAPTYGTIDTYSGPYRFFGDGLTAINSFGQLASMLAAFRNYGAVKDKLKVYLSDIAVPQIVNSGLNQFVMDRNEEDAQSWMIGNWMGVEFYQSNLLPVHTSGTVGTSGRILTVVSVNDPTGNNVTSITFSDTTANDTGSVVAGDLFQFQDGVAGQINERFLTFIGHIPCAQPVQFRALANAATVANAITINVFPALVWAAGNPNQNLSTPITAGMEVKALPSHRAGLIVGGDALFLGMPRLPDQAPFPTANEIDPDTGVSLRLTYGTLFGQNQFGWIHDLVWGSSLVPEYAMRIAFPLTQ